MGIKERLWGYLAELCIYAHVNLRVWAIWFRTKEVGEGMKREGRE